MSEEPLSLKGKDLTRLNSGGTANNPSVLRGKMLEPKKPEPMGVTIGDETISTVQHRDSGRLFGVGIPKRSELGSEPKITVKLTELNPPEGKSAETINLELTDLKTKLNTEGSPWSIFEESKK